MPRPPRSSSGGNARRRREPDPGRPNWEPRERAKPNRAGRPAGGRAQHDWHDRAAGSGDAPARHRGSSAAGAARRDDRDQPRGHRDRNQQRDRRDRDYSDRDNRTSDRGKVRDRNDRNRNDRTQHRRNDRNDRTNNRDRSDNRDRTQQRDRQHNDHFVRRDSVYYPSRHAAPFAAQDDAVRERLAARTVRAEDVAGAAFADLGLGAGIVGALTGLGASDPFPIQAAAIPEVIAGRDVLGRGRTGSGKTIAFAAPIVELLLRNRPERRAVGRPPRALILAPTRELAAQIDRTVQAVGKAVGIFTTTVVGGVRQGTQVRALERGVDILIGTPGRIEDLVAQRHLDLGRVEIAVLDEADHMCELGFVEPVQRILRMTRPDSQKLLFSATLDRDVDALVHEFLRDPAVLEVADETQETSTIDHRVFVVERDDKDAVLDRLARAAGPVLMFTRTRSYAERLTEQFVEAGIRAASLHGDLNQARRTRSLDLLQRGKVDVLVATDVAARGIHVDRVALVVQADPPDEYKTYTHRAGRTGRAGRAGVVVTIVAPSRRRRMQELLERAEIDAPMIPVGPADAALDEF